MRADPTSLLRQVRQIEIRARHLVTDPIAGAWHSSYKGQGMDFEDVREYIPGDDVRGIDWNVTARTGRPFIKRFREERELTLLLAIDVSASARYGTQHPDKRERAAELAAILALSATRNNDKVGLLLFTDHTEHYLPPRKGRQHILRLIRDTLHHSPSSPHTHLAQALQHLHRTQRRRAVIFLITDFLQDQSGQLPDPEDPRDPHLHALAITARRHDLTCLLLTDPRERSLPPAGILTVQDAETGEILEMDTRDRQRLEAYAQRTRQRSDALLKAIRRRGADAIAITPQTSCIDALRRLFESRSKRR